MNPEGVSPLSRLSATWGTQLPWPVLARAGWIALLIAVAIRVIVTIRIYFIEVRTPCRGNACQGPPSMTSEQMHALHEMGVSPDTYAAWCAIFLVCFIAANCALAAVIVWRRPNDSMATFAALVLTLFGGLSFGLPDQLFRQWAPAWWPPMTLLALLGSIGIMAFLYLFPDGRPVPRWPGAVLAVWALTQIPTYLAPGLTQTVIQVLGPLSNPVQAIISLGAFGSLIYSQIYRYRRVSTPSQREQTKWVVYGIATAIAAWIGLLVYWNVSDVNAGGYNPITVFVSEVFGYAVWLLIPLSIGVGILRYRLWDIDVLINRTLLYGALTAGVVGIYVLTIGYLGVLFRTGNNLLFSLVATGVVAVAFHPARERLQRGINHLMYGERDEPYAVLSRLGQRLEATVAPEATLSSIVETIAQALRLPYAAIGIRQGDALVMAAACGSPVPSSLHLPLSYGREPVGELIVGPRARGEEFTSADRRLLDDVARQVEIAVHAVRVTAALQRSRERLVLVREEERRRLRRDLHDGIGPALASMLLQAETAQDLVRCDPAQSEALLTGLVEQLSTATADIRRLVYNLRPPALDDLGLLGAIRAQVRQYEHTLLQIWLDLPDSMPALPAAAEVAAYRIAQEALTNVVRHADARRCTVRIEVGDVLQVEIVDDGRGLPPGMQAGVGLMSMRERAEELGGTCVAEPVAGGGVRIRARLPVTTTGDGV